MPPDLSDQQYAAMKLIAGESLTSEQIAERVGIRSARSLLSPLSQDCSIAYVGGPGRGYRGTWRLTEHGKRRLALAQQKREP